MLTKRSLSLTDDYVLLISPHQFSHQGRLLSGRVGRGQGVL
ncbi:hypothetical protein ACVRZR_09525 [Streptococcus entericus]